LFVPSQHFFSYIARHEKRFADGIEVKYARGVLITFLSKGLAIPIGIASSIITARYLGPSGRGVLTLLLVLQGFAIQFGTFGMNASITYFAARDRNSSSNVASNAVFLALVVGSLIAFAFYLVGKFSPHILLGNVSPFYLNLFLLAIPFGFLQQFLQNFFIAHQHITVYNVLDLVTRGLLLVGYILVLIVLGLSVEAAVICFTVVSAISAVVYLVRVNAIAPIRFSFDTDLFRQMLRYGARTYAASFLMFLVFRTNIFLINLYLGEKASGIYSVTMQFSDLVYLLPTTMGLLLFPKVTENLNDDGVLTAKAYRFSLAVMGLICISILIVGRFVVVLMFGSAFEGAVVPLYWLTPGIVALSLATILNNDLAARGLPPIVIIAPAIALLVNVVVNVLVLNSLGLVAASIASSLAYGIMALVLTVYFVRRLKINPKHLFFIKREDITSIRFR
jgi:O-antigen/teichoic acid export membrane protein